MAALSNPQKEVFNQSITNKLPLPTEDVAVVEAQMDYVHFLRHKHAGNLSAEWADYEKKLLIKRSQLNSGPLQSVQMPPDILQGHGPFRVAAYTGVNEQKNSVFGLELRPGVHSQLEKSVGYLPRSSLDFLVTDVSKTTDQSWQINRITFFDLALTPEFTLFFPQWTWQLKWQWNNSIPGYCIKCNVHSLEYQLGLTLDFDHSWRWGVLADMLAEQSIFFKDNYRLALGPMTFFHYNAPSVGQLQVSCKYLTDTITSSANSMFTVDGRIYDISPHVSLEYGTNLFTDQNRKWQSDQSFGFSYDFSW